MDNREQLEQMAARWIARRDMGPWTEADVQGLSSWLAQSAGHRAAYYRLNAAWHEAGRLRVLGGGAERARTNPDAPAAIATDIAETAGSAVAHVHLPWAPGATNRRLVFKTAAAIAATLLVHVVAILFLFNGQLLDPNRHSTAIGELQSISMADGSRVTLNTNSTLRISLNRSVRQIDLDRGEAFFEVAKEPRRPFVVVAGTRKFVAVGTQFSVHREGDAVQVLISEGTVRMEPSGRTNGSAQKPAAAILDGDVLLSAGTIAHYQNGHARVQPRTISEIDERLSWRVGLLTFRESSLAHAVVEFNRYNTRQIIIEDPALAAIQVGGVFRCTNPDAFVRVLERRFLIRASVDGNRILLSTGTAR